jgi:hypothetical protein
VDLNPGLDREVRNDNHGIPEKGSNPEMGSNVENPENGSGMSRMP